MASSHEINILGSWHQTHDFSVISRLCYLQDHQHGPMTVQIINSFIRKKLFIIIKKIIISLQNNSLNSNKLFFEGIIINLGLGKDLLPKVGHSSLLW